MKRLLDGEHDSVTKEESEWPVPSTRFDRFGCAYAIDVKFLEYSGMTSLLHSPSL